MEHYVSIVKKIQNFEKSEFEILINSLSKYQKKTRGRACLVKNQKILELEHSNMFELQNKIILFELLVY